MTKDMVKVKDLLNKINMNCVKGKLSVQDYFDFIDSLKENLPTRKQRK